MHAARRAAGEAGAPLLLAVSGGLDSMVLLHAMAAVARPRISAVATFDHGTGPEASNAARRVLRAATTLGLPVVRGRSAGAPPGGGREAAWRRERYCFLRAEAARRGARVVTAHTEDDQVETVLMRTMRGAGARGLAALYAPSSIVRPFVGLRRVALAAYAAEESIVWTEDPSNASRAHLRNRVRLDLLPALRGVAPEIERELLALARGAAAWRAEVEAFVDTRLVVTARGADAIEIDVTELEGLGADSLSVLWSALAGRAGLALDRRGTRRLAEFTISRPRSGAIPLSGGWVLECRRLRYLLHRPSARGHQPVTLPEEGSVEWGGFRFLAVEQEATPISGGEGLWRAALAGGVPPVIRTWRAGDRLAVSGGQPRRRVKRYLSEAGVLGGDRADWPVVEVAGDVVWIPGVRRSDAATERSGRPVRHYVCERIDR